MNTESNSPHPDEKSSDENNVYILITECLQNDFFLADDNRLCLPRDVVANMLIGTADEQSLDEIYEKNDRHGRRQFRYDLFHRSETDKGPLYRFFEAATSHRESKLHIINIKDWHIPSETYDRERRLYGSHCEAESWGAKSIDGFEKFLEPWLYTKNPKENLGKAMSIKGYSADPEKKVINYEVHVDSLFDFRAPNGESESLLTNILNELIKEKPKVYVVAIGVYSDIKMMTLLTGLLQYRYINNLITSDVLTAAPNLERHLVGLDFADKVLGVEIMHDLNELAGVLHEKCEDRIDLKIIKHSPKFQDYRTYFRDKQTVLSYQDTILNEYVGLTEERAAKVYNRVFLANNSLVITGFIMLGLTIVGGILHFLDPQKYSGDVLLLTGGLGTLQILTSFILNPLQSLRQNLNNLVRLRNYLETYSTVTALMRHHLTTPQILNDAASQPRQEPTKIISHVRQQMDIIEDVAEQMTRNFRDLSEGRLPSQDKQSDGTGSDVDPHSSDKPPSQDNEQNL